MIQPQRYISGDSDAPRAPQAVASPCPAAPNLTSAATDAQAGIVACCDEIRQMLLEKNAAYGNSAFDPVRIFSKADPIEQINVRIDDKISRLMRGADSGEDTELDLIGYLILKRVARSLSRVK